MTEEDQIQQISPNYCLKCEGELNDQNKSTSIRCSICLQWAHTKCFGITKAIQEAFDSIKKFGFGWMCTTCNPTDVESPKAQESDTESVVKNETQLEQALQTEMPVSVQIEVVQEENNETEEIVKKKHQKQKKRITKKIRLAQLKQAFLESSDPGSADTGTEESLCSQQAEMPVSVEIEEIKEQNETRKTVKKRDQRNRIRKKLNPSDFKHACPECGKKHYTPSALKMHMRKHSGEKPFPCDVCGKYFAQISGVVQHKKVFHSGEKISSYTPKPAMCHVCGKVLKDGAYLKEHQLKMHSSGEKSISCSLCEQKFRVRRELSVHMSRIHATVEQKPLCHICGSRFTDNQGLKFHLQMHRNEKPFSCEFCDRKFGRSYSLKIHLRVHTGEKPFSCEVCFKRFSQKHSLNSHRKNVHSSEGQVSEEAYFFLNSKNLESDTNF